MIIEKTYKAKGRKKQEIKKSKKKRQVVTTADKKGQCFQPGSGSKHENYSVRECSM